MQKQKLILFDWGNIVESHETGYTTFQAFGDLFQSLGYPTNNILKNTTGSMLCCPSLP